MIILERLWSELRHRLRAIFRRNDLEDELRAELELHLEMETEKLVKAGMSPSEAKRNAMLTFGGVDRVAEAARDARGTSWLDVARQDVSYAVRQLYVDRRYAAVVVATLALGIGANAAVFPLIDRLFFQMPPAVTAPEELMRLYRHHPATEYGPGYIISPFPYPAIRNVAAALPANAKLVTYGSYPAQFGRGENPARVETVRFGPGYFNLLGVRTILGRLPTEEEESATNALPVALISEHEWRARYGGARDVIGRKVELRFEEYEIIGVLQRDFRGVDASAADYWIPLGRSRPIDRKPWTEAWNVSGTNVLIRAPVETHERIVAIAGSVATRDAPDHIKDLTVSSGSILASTGPDEQAPELGIATRLAGVSAILLLIACANIANLNLARAVRRRREIAVRLALGISRSRLVMLLTMETLLLALVSAAAAMLVAMWVGGVLRTALFPDMTWPGSPLPWRTALFTLAIAVTTGLLAGLPSAFRSSDFELSDALRAGARDNSESRFRLRNGLVAAQAGLSVILLVAAATFVMSLHSAKSIDTGFDVDKLAFARLRFDGFEERSKERAALMPVILDRVKQLPGVEMVAASNGQPFEEHAWIGLYDKNDREIDFAGIPPTFQVVSPDFFQVSGLRLLAGRAFGEEDRDAATPVIVVNRQMAEEMWPGRSPLGECIRTQPSGVCSRVIGVVETAHRHDLVESKPFAHYYRSLAQNPREMPSTIVIRTKPAALNSVMEEARAYMRSMLPPGAFPDVEAAGKGFERELRPWRLGASLFSSLGLLALLIAIIGTYSTVSYTVHQRTQEMGIRIALGARATQVMSLVVEGSVRVVGIGVLMGIAAVLALGRLIDALLYDTSPRDPVILGIVTIVLIVAAAAAAFVPAWRASHVDPTVALRAD